STMPSSIYSTAFAAAACFCSSSVISLFRFSCFISGEGGGFGVGIERPARPRGEIEGVGKSGPQPLNPRPGDHRAVICAKLRWRHDKADARPGREFLQ